MYREFCILPLVALCLCGCKTRIAEELTYNDNLFADCPVSEARSTVLSPDLDCSYPAQIACTDSLIVILDWGVNEDLFHVFSRKGECIAKFGRRGRGNGELVNPAPYFCLDGEKVIIADIDKVVEYDLSRLNDQDFISQRTYASMDGIRPQSIIKKEDVMLGLWDKDARFSLLSSGAAPASYGYFPPFGDAHGPEYVSVIWKYMPKTCVSPDKKHLAQGTYIGAVLDILTLSEGIAPVTTRYIYEPVYDIVDAYNITMNAGTRIGFDAIDATDGFIYTLLNVVYGEELQRPDPEMPFADEISVFDWEGNAVRVIKTSDMMMTLCACSDKVLYATSWRDGKYDLVELDIASE